MARAVIAATVDAAGLSEALDLAWESFNRAARGDVGWDITAATAEARPW